jgi:hypothetical protein
LAFHLEREADYSSPSSAEVKEWVELYLHSPNTPAWRGTQLGGAHNGKNYEKSQNEPAHGTVVSKLFKSL